MKMFLFFFLKGPRKGMERVPSQVPLLLVSLLVPVTLQRISAL